MSENKLWRVDHSIRKSRADSLQIECNWVIAPDRKEAREIADEELEFLSDVYHDAWIVGVSEFYPTMTVPSHADDLKCLPYGDDEGKTISEWMAIYGYSPLNLSLGLEAV